MVRSSTADTGASSRLRDLRDGVEVAAGARSCGSQVAAATMASTNGMTMDTCSGNHTPPVQVAVDRRIARRDAGDDDAEDGDTQRRGRETLRAAPGGPG